MLKFVIPVMAFLALVVLLAFGLNPHRDIHALPSPLIGERAPKLDLMDVMDPSRHVDNAALKGQVYVLNVWGTWCVECRVEHEELLAIAQQHVVPLIGLDYMDQRDKAKQWLTQLGNPYESVGFDTDGRTAIDWGVYGARRPFWSTAEGEFSTSSYRRSRRRSGNTNFLPRIAAARRSGA